MYEGSCRLQLYTALQIILTGLSQGENSKTNICLALAGDVECMVVCSVTCLKARAVSSSTQCCKPLSQKCPHASTAGAKRKCWKLECSWGYSSWWQCHSYIASSSRKCWKPDKKMYAFPQTVVTGMFHVQISHRFI